MLNNKIKIIFGFYVFITIHGCNISKNEKKLLPEDYLAKMEHYDLRTMEVPLYEIDNNSLFPILDSIINIEKNCYFYNKEESGFLITERIIDSDSTLVYSSLYIKDFDYSFCEGIFEYKNHCFIIKSQNYFRLFNKSNKTKEIQFFDYDYSKEKVYEDDRWSGYYCIEKNNLIILKAIYPCTKKTNLN